MATLNIATVVTASGTVDHLGPGSKYGINLAGNLVVPDMTFSHESLPMMTNEILKDIFKNASVTSYLTTAVIPAGYAASEFNWTVVGNTVDGFDFTQYITEYKTSEPTITLSLVNLFVTYKISVVNADTSSTTDHVKIILFRIM
jgi:hypothetical protein